MKAYRIMNREDSRSLAEYLTENGQLLLPMVELIEGSRMAIDELIDVSGRASIEAENTHEGDLAGETRSIVAAPPQGGLPSVGFQKADIANQTGARDVGI